MIRTINTTAATFATELVRFCGFSLTTDGTVYKGVGGVVAGKSARVAFMGRQDKVTLTIHNWFFDGNNKEEDETFTFTTDFFTAYKQLKKYNLLEE